MSAGHFKLDNLVVLLDNNNLQIDGRVDEVMSVYPVKEKLQAFGWEVEETDGHDVKAYGLLDHARQVKNKPFYHSKNNKRQRSIFYGEPGRMAWGCCQ